MARERSPDRDKAKQIWLGSGGTMKLKDIAAALSIGDSKVPKWKALDKWDEELKGSAPRRGAPKGNKNAVGNSSGAPAGNKRAVGN